MVYCGIVNAVNLSPIKKIKQTWEPDNRKKKLQMFIGGTLKECIKLVRHVNSDAISEGDISRIVIIPIVQAIRMCTNMNFR